MACRISYLYRAALSLHVTLFCILPAFAAQGEERSSHLEVALPMLAPLVKRTLPSVVSVASTKHVPNHAHIVDPAAGFPDAPIPRNITEVGSGMILDGDLGLVVTANHVIDEAERITLSLANGARVEARLVAASRHDDLAILRIAASGLTAVAIADSRFEVGDFVLAIGNALELGQSVTLGIISALHRTCPGIENMDLIVTDALIDRGSSGGPLINMQGELVGINVARVGHSEVGGFGFAVPANAIRGLLARALLQPS
jgi:S1-C subfamily serine protease